MDLIKRYIAETGEKPVKVENDGNLGYTLDFTAWLMKLLEKKEQGNDIKQDVIRCTCDIEVYDEILKDDNFIYCTNCDNIV